MYRQGTAEAWDEEGRCTDEEQPRLQDEEGRCTDEEQQRGDGQTYRQQHEKTRHNKNNYSVAIIYFYSFSHYSLYLNHCVHIIDTMMFTTVARLREEMWCDWGHLGLSSELNERDELCRCWALVDPSMRK